MYSTCVSSELCEFIPIIYDCFFSTLPFLLVYQLSHCHYSHTAAHALVVLSYFGCLIEQGGYLVQVNISINIAPFLNMYINAGLIQEWMSRTQVFEQSKRLSENCSTWTNCPLCCELDCRIGGTRRRPEVGAGPFQESFNCLGHQQAPTPAPAPAQASAQPSD